MSTLLGTAWAEFRMQVSRWPMWVLPAAVLVILLATGGFALDSVQDPRSSAARAVGSQAIGVNLLILVVIGALVADRWMRDRQLGVQELLDAAPASQPARLWGKYLGVLAGSAIPLLAVWAVLAARLAVHYRDAGVAGTAGAAYLAIMLPGLAFVTAFGLAGAIHHGHRTEYRLIASVRPSQDARPVSPGLEDGYMALMRDRRMPASQTAQ